MHMRKTAKGICLALSLILLVNVAGLEVLAADSSVQQGADETGAVQGNDAKVLDDTDKGSADKTSDPAAGNTEDSGKDDEAQGDSSQPKDPASGENSTDPSEDGTPSEDNTDTDEGDTPSEEPKPEVTVGKVEGITAKLVNNQLKVTWNQVADAAKYRVDVLKYADGVQVSTHEAPGTEVLVNVAQGEKYYIEVRALKEGEDGTQVDLAVGKIPAILLAAPSVTAKPEETEIKFSWGAVAGAAQYEVTFNGKTEKVTATSYEAKNLAKGKAYSFSVKALCVFSEDGKDYPYESAVTTVNTSTKIEKPAKVDELTAIDGDKSAILTWTKAARAESYVIYRYNDSSKKWEVVKKDVTKLTYTDKKLKQGKKYKYRVAAENSGGVGAQSSTVTVSVKKTPDTVRSIGYKAVVKSRAPLFTSKKGTKRVKYLKAGTRVTTVDYGNRRYKIKLSDGKYYWLSKDRLRFTASIWTTKDYSTKTKQDFVNKKGYKSKTKYLIWVSQYTQRVVIYKGSKGKWKVVRSGQCATGTHKNMTPKRTMYLTYRKKGRYYRTQYESPIVYFTGGNAFHSRIKLYSGGYADATIGRPKSHGCVRLLQPEIDYIYKYCPRGTTVVSY